MKEATGDLWTHKPADGRAITTNGYVNVKGEATMGAGCALEARAKFPGIARILGQMIDLNGNHVWTLTTFADGEDQSPVFLFSFPVKHHWREIADQSLIERSAKELVERASQYDLRNIVLPRPGCGNGRLRCEEVRPILEPILDDRFTVITYG